MLDDDSDTTAVDTMQGVVMSMICENCGMLTEPYNDGGCEFGDHQVLKEVEK